MKKKKTTKKPDWKAIKYASIRGESDIDLAVIFNVKRTAIRQRRCREKWPAPLTADQRAMLDAMLYPRAIPKVPWEESIKKPKTLWQRLKELCNL